MAADVELSNQKLGIRNSQSGILVQEDKAMIIVMKMGATAQEVSGVVGRINSMGYKPHLSSGEERVIIGVIGNDRPVDSEDFLSLGGVERVVPILHPYKLASRDFKPSDTVIRVNDALIGGKNVAFMAGPCS